MNKIFVYTCSILLTFNALSQDFSKVKIDVEKLKFNTTLSEIPAFADSTGLVYFQNKKSLKRFSQYYDLYWIDTLNLNKGMGQAERVSLTEQLTLVTNYHEGPCFIDEKNNRIYITISALDKKQMKKEKKLQNLYSNKLRLIEGDYHNGIISNLIEFPFNNPNYNVGHAAFSEASQRLYFASTKPGGYGKSDLYYTQKNSQGAWEEPINLGKRVNSADNEVFPTIKNGVLYFASNGQKKQKGTDLDLFYVFEKDIDVKSPIELTAMNTDRDDFSICFHSQKDTLFGYFASNRNNNFTEDDDIYRFTFSNVFYSDSYDLFVRISREDEIVTNGEIALLDKDGNVLEKLKSIKNGYYTSSKLIKGDIYLISFQDSLESKLFTLEPNVIYPSVYKSFDLENDAMYEDSLIVTNIESLVSKFDSSDLSEFKIDTLLKALNNVYEEDTSLAITDTSILTEVKSIPKKNVQKKVEERLNFNKKESFKPIYFGFDSYMVTDYSKSKLEKLIELLKASEVKYIVLNAYTDSRGGEEYNMKLSVKRALACRQYLISQGIQESKIKYTGFGESNRVNDCGDVPCSDERHKLNRRIEFTLLYN